MKIAAFLCALLLGIGSAAAQNIGPNQTGPGGGVAGNSHVGLALSGGTLTGPLTSVGITDSVGITTSGGIADSGGINTTAATAYSIGGNTILNIINPGNANPVLAIGPGACAAMTSSANFNMCIGAGALASYTGSSSAELVAIGPKAQANLVAPAVHDVCVGTYCQHYETTGNSDTAMGGDSMRNSIGISNVTAYGSYSAGNYYGQLSTFVGGNAMVGNGASVTVSGTITASDVISLTFTGTFTGSPVTITYTVGAGNTLTQIAAGIATAMTASSALVNADIREQTDAQATPNTVSVAMPGTALIGEAITVTNSSSGGISETITITNGITAATTRNVGVGYDAEYGSRWVSASYEDCLGAFCFANMTTGTQNDCLGDQCGMNSTTMNFMAALGDEAFLNATSGNSVTGIGWEVGKACTTCRAVTLVGKGAGTSTLTTGNDIIIISDGSACDTNTANQMLLCGSGGTFMNTLLTNNAVTLTKMTGPVQVTGTTFTISGCSTTTLVGGASRGSFHSGTTGTCTPVITMGGATGISGVTNGWACFAVDVTTPADIIQQTASNGTTATLSGTTASGDVIIFNCEPY